MDDQKLPSKKPLVYIASPYTKGDPAINTNYQLKMFNRLLDDGVVIPYIPLVTHYLHIYYPRPYQDWINYDNQLIYNMDACLRLDASCVRLSYRINESSGADAEVRLFHVLGKPVFYSTSHLYQWVRNGDFQNGRERECFPSSLAAG